MPQAAFDLAYVLSQGMFRFEHVFFCGRLLLDGFFDELNQKRRFFFAYFGAQLLVNFYRLQHSLSPLRT